MDFVNHIRDNVAKSDASDTILPSHVIHHPIPIVAATAGLDLQYSNPDPP